ncbi:MAG: hypothetical protein HY831_01325 [Candidatus Aenigmarchaeota archaeon]|nr:hypothetical protein [Candidatus Aenigmarchaeota archaeon]
MENEKYPSYFTATLIVYLLVFFLSLSIIPAGFYIIDHILLILILVAPIVVFILYLIEKPPISQRFMRFLFVFLAMFAVFIGLILTYLFF